MASDDVALTNRVPLESGGRVARTGFSYQDHVTAQFCLEALLDGAPDEVWIEQHDDIALIWRTTDATPTIEFVQVKAQARKSRWSIAAITARENDVVGTSLLERSLAQARGVTDVRFRIITSIDIDDRLAILRDTLAGETRSGPEFEQLACEIRDRLPDAIAPSGMSVSDWVLRCQWEKRADSADALRALNLRHLERLLTIRKKQLPYEHRDAMYEDLLQRISDAATADLSVYVDAYKLTRSSLAAWFDAQLAHFVHVNVLPPMAYDELLAHCREVTELEIRTRVGKKYLPELYVERDIDSVCAEFVTGDVKTMIVVEKAGSGKTNLLCHVALEYASTRPVFFIAGRTALGNDGLVGEILNRLPRVQLEALFRDLAQRAAPLLVIIDGINENSSPPNMRDALIRLLQFISDKPIKLLISCRDLFWPNFDGEHWSANTVRAGARARARARATSHALRDFSAQEFEIARQRYFSYFHVVASLRGEAKIKCRHPLLLRFFCEAYGTDGTVATYHTFNDIRLKTLFDIYWERKLDRIRDLEGGAFIRTVVKELLFALAEFLLTSERKEIAAHEILGIGNKIGPSFDAALTCICDEDIIVAQDGELGITTFVYDEFMEYTMSRYLFERHDWRRAGGATVARALLDLVDAHEHYVHILNVAQYLLLWLEDENPGAHVAVVTALAKENRAEMRRLLAIAFPKFREITSPLIEAFAQLVHISDEAARADAAAALGRLLHRRSLHGSLLPAFRIVARDRRPFVATALLAGLTAATELPRTVLQHIARLALHSDADVRAAVAEFLPSDAAHEGTELADVLNQLAEDAVEAVQGAALVAARTICTKPADFSQILLRATASYVISKNVDWMLTNADAWLRACNPAQIAASLVESHDSTLDKSALRLLRYMAPAEARQTIETVLSHRDYRSFHEAIRSAHLLGEPATALLDRFTSIAKRMQDDQRPLRGALRKLERSARLRRRAAETLFLTADWQFLSSLESMATLNLWRMLLLHPGGLSSDRRPAFLTLLVPLTTHFSTTDGKQLLIEAATYAIKHHDKELLTWASTILATVHGWTEREAASVAVVYASMAGHGAGLLTAVRYLATTSSADSWARALLMSGNAGVVGLAMRVITSRHLPLSEVVAETARQWDIAACQWVVDCVQLDSKTIPLLLRMAEAWEEHFMFAPLLQLSLRIESETRLALKWYTGLRSVIRTWPDDDVDIKIYGRLPDDVREQARCAVVHAFTALSERIAAAQSDAENIRELAARCHGLSSMNPCDVGWLWR